MRRYTLITFLLLALYSGSAKPTHAATFGFTDFRPTPAMTCIQFNDPGKAVSFSFVTPADRSGKTLSYAKFFVQSVVAPGFPLVVELRSDNNGLPGDLVSQGTVIPGSLRYSWCTVSLTPSVLTGGQRYHLVIHPADGCGTQSQYINVGFQIGRYRTDMNVLLDLGRDWFTAPNSDPTVILGFTDGVEWGQPYCDRASTCSIYGSGANSRYGERFQLATPMAVRRVSLVVRRKGWPAADLRMSIFDESTGSTVVDEKFCSPGDIPFWDATWTSHILTTPVALTNGRFYRLCLYQDGQQGDSSNCYLAHYQYSGSPSASFGGRDCRLIYWNMSTGSLTNDYYNEMYFRLDTGGIEVQRVTAFRVTSTAATVVVETNKATNAVVEYGQTTGYGATLSHTGTVHTFQLSGLAPATTYHYRFNLVDPNDPTDTLVAEDYRFRTDPSEQPINVTVFGDSQSVDSNSFFTLMGKYPHDLVVTTGDCVELHDMPDSECTFDRACKEWKWLLRDITPLTQNCPLFTCLGNHDSYYFTNPAPMQAYNSIALMPTNGSGNGRFYSFDYGPAHFCVLDSQWSNYTNVGAAQRAWAENDLQSSNKTFKVVALHMPVYGVAVDDTNFRVADWQELHDMFKRCGVKLVLTGHRHVYNRYCKDGIYYIVTGIPNWVNYTDDSFEQGWSGMPTKPNFGGDPGTIPEYINKPGWLQLQISPSGFSGAYISLLGQELDSFGSYAPDPSVPAPMSIGQVKRNSGGSLANITGTVTSTENDWTQRLYIRDDQSREGIWVTLDMPTSLRRGDHMHISGTLTTDSDELKISGKLTSAPVTNGGPPVPVSINTSAMSGGPIGSWQGIYGGSGLGSTGDLVRVTGVVTDVDSQHAVFYLSDNSGVIADNKLKGAVRVKCAPGATLPQEGSWCVVTGISSCQRLSNKIYSVLCPRDATDIQRIK